MTMRKVVFPDAQFVITDKEGTVHTLSAIEQLTILISLPNKSMGTFSLGEMRLRIPIVEKLDAAARTKEAEILFEDAEYTLIQKELELSIWGGVSKSALALADAVENAEVVEIKEVKKV